jgi:hypothetical protein
VKRSSVGSDVVGEVAAFSAAEGQGIVVDGDQRAYRFHCTQITGGARSISAGTPVRFDVVAGHLGQWEASRLRAVGGDSFLCAVCAAPVEGRSGTYEICPVCGWEDDPVQYDDPAYADGANAISLADARSAWDTAAAGAEG